LIKIDLAVFSFANQFWLIANQFEILEQKC